MGMLMNFLGGAAKSLAGSIDQDRLEKKRIEDDERQFAKQVSWAKAAEAIRANMQTKTAIPTPTPFGAPVKDASGNWVQPTKTPVGALLDETTGDVVRPAALEDGPSVPTMDPNAPTQYQAAMLEQKSLDRESRIEAAKIRGSRGGSSRAEVGDDGLTAYQREQLKRTDAREARLGNQKSGGGMTEKSWREGMDSTLSSIQGAEDGKLKSIIRQYGGDNILTGDMDTEMLRDAAFSVAETYWNERKPSGKKASEPALTGKKEGDAAAYDAAAAQVKAKRPDLSDADVRAYLATKGIRP